MAKQSTLGYKKKVVWEQLNAREKQAVIKFSEDYKNFIQQAKTERATVAAVIAMAKENGFVALDTIKGPIAPGQKVYQPVQDKALLLTVVGSCGLDQGANIIGAHVDSPRLDLKVHPLWEKDGLAFWKTHYYGGIKKYQWLSQPLALHGVVFDSQGNQIDISLGDKPCDPVFTITDLLPHLAKDQMEKKLKEAVAGEDLNALCASLPVPDQDMAGRVKETVLGILNRAYGLVEEDLISAELCLVPALPPRDVGWDRSMVGAYGQDDRICVYTLARAMMHIDEPSYTAMALFVDKEEIGSVGNTGMDSNLLPDLVAELLDKTDDGYSGLALRRALRRSRALSADVNAALDPNFAGVMEKTNAAVLGCGVVLTKYTGSGGKKVTNDAHAAYMAQVRRIFNENNVVWQTGQLGKVDQGGGGTIAYMMATHGMDVVDCGAALLGMHSPFEVSHKGDLYMTYLAYQFFLAHKHRE